MWEYNYPVPSDDELYHYGVLGMRWGVRKAYRKMGRNADLEQYAVKKDAKAAKFRVKAERVHQKKDMADANKLSLKSAKQHKKAVKYARKADRTDDPDKADKLNYKSAKAASKSADLKRLGDEFSKTAPYGDKALGYLDKQNKHAADAAAARRKIAKNQLYINRMTRKISDLSPEDREAGKEWIDEYLKRVS